MKLPFTIDQFLNVFQTYNLSIWPAQIVAYILGALAVILVLRRTVSGDRIIAGILSLMWLMNGAVYHLIFFSPINKAAYLFGAIFLIQGLLFFHGGVLKNKITFRWELSLYSLFGALCLLYAMLIYPLLGALAGHGYPRGPVFGVAPCPTTIFTFGLLLWTQKPLPKYLVIIPLIWSLIGFVAALQLGIREDIGLLLAGVIGTFLIVLRDRKGRPAEVAGRSRT